ncbi:MAG TPA: SGNH/GDSL hydrolase family protein [Solirubrobacteraceae bacterium]|jgi:hypothetical protein
MSSERGQDTVEWAGLLVLVALIIGALFLSHTPQAIAHGVSCAVTKAFGGSGNCSSGTAGPAPVSGAPWDSSDPVARATWGGYVSLGDSYSAGEGLGDYEPGSSVHQSQCRVSVLGHCIYHKDPKVIDGCDRSADAYNGTVSNQYTFKDGKQTWACSGSITKDIFDPGDPTCSAGHASGHYGEGCQADRVGPDTSLITMSIGGNDAGFADDLKNCYENRFKLHWSKSCSYEGPDINSKIAGIPANLTADLQALRARSPHARIIIMTYPKLFPDPPTGNAACVTFVHVCLTPSDQQFFNQEAVRLDDTICAAVQSAGVGAECITASGAFTGCEIGQADSCLQSPASHISGSTGLGINPGAFHPTDRGQQILGQLVNQEIQKPPPGRGGP